MKDLIKFLLFFTIIISLQSAIAEEETANDPQQEDTSESEQTEEDSSEDKDLTFMDFLITEVIPAFGGLEHIFLTTKPSFSIHFTQGGATLIDCSLELKLKQLETIQYRIIDSDTDNFPVNMNIGQPKWLFFNASCGEQSISPDKNHFNIFFTVKDENLEDSYYELGVNAFDKNQLKIKMHSMEMEVIIEEVEQEILLSSYGDIMKFSKALEEYKDDGDTYILPLDLWKPLNNKLKSSNLQENNDSIKLKKVKVTHIIDIDGTAQLTFPTSVNNVTEYTDVLAPIKGQIFIPEEEEADLIPAIDFSLDYRQTDVAVSTVHEDQTVQSKVVSSVHGNQTVQLRGENMGNVQSIDLSIVLPYDNTVSLMEYEGDINIHGTIKLDSDFRCLGGNRTPFNCEAEIQNRVIEINNCRIGENYFLIRLPFKHSESSIQQYDIVGAIVQSTSCF